MPLFVSGQTKIIERLKKNIQTSERQLPQLSNIFLLCDQGYSLHADTLMAYADRAESIAVKINHRLQVLKSMYFKSAALTNKGLVDSSLKLAEKCLAVLKNEKPDLELEANLLNQKGRCYVRMNRYKEAIEMGYAVIKIAEQSGNILQQIKGKTLIGWAYLEMGQLKDAINWHLQALNTTGDSALLDKYAILYANIATNYNGLDKLDAAFYFINKGISSSRKYENLFALSNSLAIQSELFVKAGKPKLSEPALKEVVEIRKQIGDPFYIASDLAQLGYYYAHYGQPQKGIAACNEGITLAKKYHLNTKLFFLYSSLADNYKAMGNDKKYADVLQDIIFLKDSVYEKNSAGALAEMQTKFELQKKENTIIQQKLDIVQKDYLLYGSLLLAFFGLVLFYLLFQLYRKKQRLKMEMALTEEKQLSITAVKEAEENERRRIAADLHDNLGAYAASIVANIDTISQQSQFNNTAIGALKELNTNAQSIVSQLGDTIWVLKRNTVSLTAVSDRIKLVIQKVQPSYPNIRIDVTESITDDSTLLPSQGFHLFQIIQEALINALKHSNCTAIKINFIANSRWLVEIKDNGQGIKYLAAVKSGGNGIHNMNGRSRDAGFTVEWKQAAPGGTCVMIQPTTN